MIRKTDADGFGRTLFVMLWPALLLPLGGLTFLIGRMLDVWWLSFGGLIACALGATAPAVTASLAYAGWRSGASSSTDDARRDSHGRLTILALAWLVALVVGFLIWRFLATFDGR